MFTASARPPLQQGPGQGCPGGALPQSPQALTGRSRRLRLEQTGPACALAPQLRLVWLSSGWVTLGELLTLSELHLASSSVEMSLALPPRVMVRKHTQDYLRLLELCTSFFSVLFVDGFLDLPDLRGDPVKYPGWTEGMCIPGFTPKRPQGPLQLGGGGSSQPTKAAWTLPVLPEPLPNPTQGQHGQECRMAESAAWLLGTWPQGQA